MKIIIRPTKLSDIPQLQQLNQETLPENYNKQFWIAMFYNGKNHSFVATEASNIIGYVFCSTNSIISFAVSEKFRNKGIGKQLMYHCLETFTEPVSLHVRVSNNVAFDLYKSLNFIVENRIIGYYVNEAEDAYRMKYIPNPNNKFDTQKKLIIK